MLPASRNGERGAAVIVLRLIGWVFVLAGLVVLGLDLYAWFGSRQFQPEVIGELWYRLSPGSLQLFQPAVQRYLHPALWDNVIQPVLLWWAFPTFLGIGAVLVLVSSGGRGGEPRRFKRR
jgi:hypothetical protein